MIKYQLFTVFFLLAKRSVASLKYLTQNVQYGHKEKLVI